MSYEHGTWISCIWFCTAKTSASSGRMKTSSCSCHQFQIKTCIRKLTPNDEKLPGFTIFHQPKQPWNMIRMCVFLYSNHVFTMLEGMASPGLHGKILMMKAWGWNRLISRFYMFWLKIHIEQNIDICCKMYGNSAKCKWQEWRKMRPMNRDWSIIYICIIGGQLTLLHVLYIPSQAFGIFFEYFSMCQCTTMVHWIPVMLPGCAMLCLEKEDFAAWSLSVDLHL